MKKDILLAFCFLTIVTSSFSTPDEGMWLPLYISRLNYEDMQNKGLKLSAEEIFSVNHSSLKDAVVIFGGGCTGEMISDQGLLITNHHCGYDNIQEHSSVEHDYLKDGFWARSREEELSNKGLTVKFLVRMEDVSEAILSHLNSEMSEEDRESMALELADSIENEAISNTNYIASVESFFEGNEFYLFVYEEFLDVRLVGAPPSSIGKFGADTDNWMWPRHTGDFSIFRVYMGPDSMPAEYSENNIPYKPKHYFPISIKGVEKDDFAMVLGFPGNTERYLSSYGIDVALKIKNPTIIKIRRKKLDIMREDMDKDDNIRIKYASKYARVANYWKYFKGQTRGLKRLGVLAKRRALENEFNNWISSKQDLILKYGNVIQDIEEAYQVIHKYTLTQQYLNEALFGSDVIKLSYKFEELSYFINDKNLKIILANQEMNKQGKLTKKEIEGIGNFWQSRIESHTSDILKEVNDHFHDYNLPTDKRILTAMLKMYYDNIPKAQLPEILENVNKKYKGDFEKYVEYIFKKSILPYKDKIEIFLKDPDYKTLNTDPIYNLMSSIIGEYRELFGQDSEVSLAYKKLDKANRLFIQGLREMKKDYKFYPDANSTMRISYGTVQDYYPADAIYFNYYTTLAGVMEKEDPDNWEFTVPEKLKELYEKKDYGRYGENGVMKVCFLTDLDITGGNSGSPVIDAEGNLIGLAFDGNWEAMSGDIAFEQTLQRTISVDIRYILFIIEKFAGVKSLIDEMDIIEASKGPVEEVKRVQEIIEDQMK